MAIEISMLHFNILHAAFQNNELKVITSVIDDGPL